MVQRLTEALATRGVVDYLEYKRAEAKYNSIMEQLQAQIEQLKQEFVAQHRVTIANFEQAEAKWRHTFAQVQEARLADYEENPTNDKEYFGHWFQVRSIPKVTVDNEQEAVKWLDQNGFDGFVVRTPSKAFVKALQADMKETQKKTGQPSPLYGIIESDAGPVAASWKRTVAVQDKKITGSD